MGFCLPRLDVLRLLGGGEVFYHPHLDVLRLLGGDEGFRLPHLDVLGLGGGEGFCRIWVYGWAFAFPRLRDSLRDESRKLGKVFYFLADLCARFIIRLCRNRTSFWLNFRTLTLRRGIQDAGGTKPGTKPVVQQSIPRLNEHVLPRRTPSATDHMPRLRLMCLFICST